MGVYLTDRRTGQVSGQFYGLSTRLFGFLGEALAALGAAQVEEAWRRDGYVPSWLAQAWATQLFEHLEELVVVTRPMPEKGPELRPIAVYRRGDPVGERWLLRGEQMSVYDTPAATAVLAFAQFCAASNGFSSTTLRPPATGSVRSPVAARRVLLRSGLFPPQRRR